jgi:hypothetical protein
MGCLQVLASFRAASTRVQLAPQLPLVASQGSQLQAVFVNLINNAVETARISGLCQ